MPHIDGKLKQVVEVLKVVVEQDPDNLELSKMLEAAVKELEEDENVPVLAEKERFDRLLVWMKQYGAAFDKLKIRYYAPDYRGMHATRDIKKGETIVYVPLNEIITLEMAFATPIGE